MKKLCHQEPSKIAQSGRKAGTSASTKRYLLIATDALNGTHNILLKPKPAKLIHSLKTDISKFEMALLPSPSYLRPIL